MTQFITLDTTMGMIVASILTAIGGSIVTGVIYAIKKLSRLFKDVEELLSLVASVRDDFNKHYEEDHNLEVSLKEIKFGLSSLMRDSLIHLYGKAVDGNKEAELLFYTEYDIYNKLGGNGYITSLKEKLDNKK